MNDTRLPELKRTAQKIVREAQKPGGSVENGEFTLGLARRLISQKMGLGDEGLDESGWKKVVKGLVLGYMVSFILTTLPSFVGLSADQIGRR